MRGHAPSLNSSSTRPPSPAASRSHARSLAASAGGSTRSTTWSSASMAGGARAARPPPPLPRCRRPGPQGSAVATWQVEGGRCGGFSHRGPCRGSWDMHAGNHLAPNTLHSTSTLPACCLSKQPRNGPQLAQIEMQSDCDGWGVGRVDALLCNNHQSMKRQAGRVCLPPRPGRQVCTGHRSMSAPESRTNFLCCSSTLHTWQHGGNAGSAQERYGQGLHGGPARRGAAQHGGAGVRGQW